MAKTKKKPAKTKVLHQWYCPHEKSFLLKVETIILAILVGLVFIFSFATFDQKWFWAAVVTLLFVGLFFLISYGLKRIYPVKEIYKLTHQGIEIIRKAGKKLAKKQVPYREIKRFKLDKLVHGGRLETKKGHHPLFFNTLKEMEKLEKILVKKVKKK